jgi:hypothetical protein
MWFSRFFLALASLVVLAFAMPLVSAHYTAVYHYSHAEYAGSLNVAAPVQLYSYDAFVRPLVYQYPETHSTVVYSGSTSPYSYPYYTTYSVPVYRNYYSVRSFPLLRAFRSMNRIEEIEYDDGEWEIEFDD